MLRKIKKINIGLIFFLCVFGVGLPPLSIYAQTDDQNLEQDEPDIEFEKPEIIDAPTIIIIFINNISFKLLTNIELSEI